MHESVVHAPNLSSGPPHKLENLRDLILHTPKGHNVLDYGSTNSDTTISRMLKFYLRKVWYQEIKSTIFPCAKRDKGNFYHIQKLCRGGLFSFRISDSDLRDEERAEIGFHR